MNWLDPTPQLNAREDYIRKLRKAMELNKIYSPSSSSDSSISPSISSLNSSLNSSPSDSK